MYAHTEQLIVKIYARKRISVDAFVICNFITIQMVIQQERHGGFLEDFSKDDNDASDAL